MKIVGLTYLNEQMSMYIKPDSSLLVNQKPFFLPDIVGEAVARLCVVARVSRLGKGIEQRFAHRYYDAVAWGLNIIYPQCANQLMQCGQLPTEAYAFDYSMVVGEFMSVEDMMSKPANLNGQLLTMDGLMCSLDEAFQTVSENLTLRMGDMVAVDIDGSVMLLKRNDVIAIEVDDNVELLCRIK